MVDVGVEAVVRVRVVVTLIGSVVGDEVIVEIVVRITDVAVNSYSGSMREST